MLGQYWRLTNGNDPQGYDLYTRHYTFDNKPKKARKFTPPGQTLVLISHDGGAVFAWQNATIPRDDGFSGVFCTVFRRESCPTLSSLLIAEACEWAYQRWSQALYTYVDSSKIRSTNPGYCFQKAGFQVFRALDGSPYRSKHNKLHLLVKEPPMIKMPEVDLSDLMGLEKPLSTLSQTPSPNPPTAPPAAEAAPEGQKRHRRTKAEIEAARAAGEKPHRKQPALLSDGTPSPYTPEHQEAAAHALGFDSAEQREQVVNWGTTGNGSAVPLPETFTEEELPDFGPLTPNPVVAGVLAAHVDAPPDAPDVQVLTDELHYLRDDVRELAGEIRKLHLSLERFRVDENRRDSTAGQAPVAVAEASGVESGPKGISKR